MSDPTAGGQVQGVAVPAGLEPLLVADPSGDAFTLIPPNIATHLPPLYAQDGKGMAAVAWLRWFAPIGSWTWYVTEYDQASGECFGYAIGLDSELGYFDRADIEALRVGPAGLRVERDLWFTPCQLHDIEELKR